MKKIALLGIMLVLMAVSVAANARIDYHFNVDSVQTEAYNCADAGCNSVNAFSGSFPNGRTTSNGQIRINYPTQLAVANGYGVYYFADGYVPQAYRATWHGNGQADFNINFNKIPVCSSVIDTFTVTNDAHANVPLVVRTSASLDATTRSAFFLTNNGVGYIPSGHEADYSADTTVILTITNSAGQVVNTQSQQMSLFASTSRQVEFSWTPDTDGSYTATVTTHVTDNQCAAVQDQAASSSFSVLPSLPQNECYTILNGLAANPIVGTNGQPVSLGFNKISNHANNYAFNGDPNWRLTPVPTSITWTVSGPTGATQTYTAAANPDNFNPTAQGFSFTPTATGMHTVTVTGIASSTMCNGLRNTGNTVTLNVNVVDPATYHVTFQIVDGGNGAPLQGATITIGGATYTTDASGTAVTAQLSPNLYAYTVSKTGYVTLPGSVNLVDVDLTLMLSLQRDNSANNPRVIFEVRNGITQAPIRGATVVMDGSGQTTNADGEATYTQVPAGQHPWTASAAGFNPASGRVATDGQHQERVIVALMPSNDGGPRTVSFHVYDGASGADLQGARVTINGAALPPNGVSGTTDNAGNMVFTNVPQGAYAFTVSLIGYNTASGGFDVGADNVHIEVALTRQTNPTTHTVTYHVMDAVTGANLPGASVAFNAIPATTDANGLASYGNVADGTYSYGVTLAGYSPAGGTTQVTGADVHVDVYLARPGTAHQVTFHVADGTTGINLPGVYVVFDGRQGTTDNAGRVVFNNVPDTGYTYTATLNGYNPASGAFTVAGDTTVEVRMFVMTGPFAVNVHVYDAQSGANLPGAFVRFDGHQGSTDVAGLVAFANVPAGSFPWDVTLAGYNTASGTSTVAGNMTLQVPLTRNGNCTSHVVTFIVRDATNALPIAGASVTMGSYSGTTDANGVLRLTVCDGTYTFTVTARGYLTAGGTVTVTADTTIFVEMARDGSPVPAPETPVMGIYVGSIRIPEIDADAGEAPVLVTFKNDGETGLDGIKVAVVSAELGLRGSVGKFDLGKNDQLTRRVVFRLEDTHPSPGLYPLRITISNDDTIRVVYRDLEVLP